MKNNLSKIENCLRSIARRNKCIKYSLGLAILFLMMGISAFSEEVVTQQEVMTTEQIAISKENLRNSVGSLQSKIDSAKAENENGNLEQTICTVNGMVHIKEEEIRHKNIHLKEFLQEVQIFLKE